MYSPAVYQRHYEERAIDAFELPAWIALHPTGISTSISFRKAVGEASACTLSQYI